MEVPPGMGPIEYQSYCFAKADPARLKAVVARTYAKWSKFPDAVNGPPKREWHPPPSPVLSDTCGSDIGLLSPCTSESGEPASPQKESATTNDGLNNEGASESSEYATEQLSESSNTPKKSRKTRLGKDSRMSKVERRNRKINTRNARSIASSATSLSQPEDNDNLDVEPGSTAADSSGQTVSSRLEPSNGILAPQSSTEAEPSKPAAGDKRKRDQDDVPTRKRARIEPSNVNSSAVLGSAGDTDEDPDTIPPLPPAMERWVEGQIESYIRGDAFAYDPPIENEKRRLKLLPLTEAEKRYLNIASPKLSKPSGTNNLVFGKIRLNDRRRDPQSLSDKAPNRVGKPPCQPPVTTKPSGIQKVTQKLKKVHNRKVEDLLGAYIATNHYCEALELKEEATELAKLYLNDVFHHPFSEYHHTHAIIVACIYFAYGGNELRRKWGAEVDQFIWPPEIPPPDCGPAIAAVRQYFLSQDSKRMRPKAARRDPTASQRASRPRDED